MTNEKREYPKNHLLDHIAAASDITLTPAQRERLDAIDAIDAERRRQMKQVHDDEDYKLYYEWQQRRTDVLGETDEQKGDGE